MKNIIILSLMITFYACANTSQGTAGTGDLSGYTIISLDSGGEKAVKYDGNDNVTEQGFLIDGKRNGMWLTYYSENNRIKTITHYSNNVLNGPFIEFNNRGQIESEVGYQNGQYHGLTAKYKFGRPTIQTSYKEGQIDGKHIEYFNNGKKQKEIDFKDGKQDGKLVYYNEEEEVTLEYTYKNGKKVEE